MKNKLKKQRTVSAVVPVFNEEKTVAGVIKTLLENALIDEVICINDGSTDKSLSILKEFKDKIQLINLKENQGKGYALVEGIKKAKGEIVVFIDECHRTQSGKLHDMMKEILPGAMFIGFTGTPLLQSCSHVSVLRLESAALRPLT